MKVSVYCLVYNHEKVLHTALEGFVNQKVNFDYEVIVHDDASTDGSRAIIEEYARRYPKIIRPIYQQENQYSKQVSIFNTFIYPRITGEYIAICEGDDYWCDPDKLQLQVDFLDAHPDYSACVHNTCKLNVTNDEKSLMYSRTQDADIGFEDVILRGAQSFHTSSVMYRRQYGANRPAFFQKAKTFGDYPLAIYLALSGKIRFISRTMSVYRSWGEGSWTQRNMTQLKKISLHYQYVADMLEEVDRYTHGQYHQLLRELVVQNRYTSIEFDEQYGQLRREPYREIFNSKPLKYRIKILLRQYLNKPYHLYRKIFRSKK